LSDIEAEQARRRDRHVAAMGVFHHCRDYAIGLPVNADGDGVHKSDTDRYEAEIWPAINGRGQ
jgi:hypothetical protein